MAREISLTDSQRSLINNLRTITTQTNTSTERLSSGKKVNSVIDDAAAYFTAKSLYNDASDFLTLKDSIDQGISTLTSTLDAADAIDSVLTQMKGIVDSISSLSSDSEKAAATTTFNELGDQISNLVEDAYYNGINLLNATSNSLSIKLSPFNDSKLEILGYDLNSTQTTVTSRSLFTAVAYDSSLGFKGLSVFVASITGFSSASTDDLTKLGDALDSAVSRLSSTVSTLGSNSSLLTTRSNFSQDIADTYNAGGDKLTLADMNEEAALLTSLQTQQQLAIQSLAITGEMQKNIVNLLTVN